MKTCVMFDIDGTLADSLPDIAASANAMRAHYGHEVLPLETISTYIGNGLGRLVEKAMSDMPEVPFAEALEYTKKYYAGHLACLTRLYPGAEMSLKRLEEHGYMLAAVTNKPDALCRPMLAQLGVLKYFSCVIGGGTEFGLKPAPGQIEHALAVTGADRSSSWMFGDNWTDVEAGAAAGVHTAFAAYGYGSEHEVKAEKTVLSFEAFAGMLLN